jgi:hypothetical protein
MGLKGGHDAKDQVLVDGFNPVKELTPQQQKVRNNALNALAIANRNSKERKRLAKEEAARKGIAIEAAKAAGVYVEPSPPVEEEILESQMFQDMRAIYKKLKGRERLEKWAKDDKNFLMLAKELMKQESVLLAAKIRKGEGEGPNGQSQSFFVVLKGLEDEKGLAEKFEDKTVDMKQVKHVLEPEAGAYEPERPAVEEAQRSDTPEGW